MLVHMVTVALLMNLAEGINSMAMQQGGLGLPGIQWRGAIRFQPDEMKPQ